MVAAIPQEFLNSLLARCDIVELIDTRVPLRKKGKNYLALCPFHTEKTPSFTVTPEKQFYYCFGCGVGGNAISFLMEYERLDFIAAVELLATDAGLVVPRAGAHQAQPATTDLYDWLEQAAQFYQQQLRLAPQALAYLEQRGLSEEVIKTFAIGYAPPGWNTLRQELGQPEALLAAGLLIKKEGGGFYDRFRDRIMFPIRDRHGRVIGFGGRVITTGEPKYLNSPETAVFHKGRELYGLYEIGRCAQPLERLWVVEGYLDSLALVQHNVGPVVAALGTAITTDHIRRLLSLSSEVIFCFDGDVAGQTAAWRVILTSLPLWQDGWALRFLVLPNGEDPDSWIRKQGAAGFVSLKTLSLSNYLFNYLLQQVDLGTLEGKAKLAHLAVPLFKKMPASVMQHKLFEHLAHLVNLEAKALKQLAASVKVDNKQRETGQKKTTTVRHSLMRLAIGLLLQYPCLATRFSKPLQQLADINLVGQPLLMELVDLLTKTPELTTAMLLEHWRTKPELYAILKQLAGYEYLIPADGVEAEFRGVLHSLNKLALAGQIETLLQQAKQVGLTQVEKQTLQTLIRTNQSSLAPEGEQ